VVSGWGRYGWSHPSIPRPHPAVNYQHHLAYMSHRGFVSSIRVVPAPAVRRHNSTDRYHPCHPDHRGFDLSIRVIQRRVTPVIHSQRSAQSLPDRSSRVRSRVLDASPPNSLGSFARFPHLSEDSLGSFCHPASAALREPSRAGDSDRPEMAIMRWNSGSRLACDDATHRSPSACHSCSKRACVTDLICTHRIEFPWLTVIACHLGHDCPDICRPDCQRYLWRKGSTLILNENCQFAS
jgi:hypothetical protein